MKTVATTSIMRRPKDGESALYMTVTPEGDTFPAGADGRAEKYTTHTVTARLYYGTVAQEDWTVEVRTADDANWYTAEMLNGMMGDICVFSIKKNGADCVVTYEVGESTWADDNAYIVIRMKNGYGTVEKQVNCYAQKRGETGERGAVLRGPQAWGDCAVGYAFQAGGEGEEYKDIVAYKGYYYSCVMAHRKTVDNAPLSAADTNGGLWKLADSVEMVATKILLSEYALVKNLGVETVEMKDAAGNVVFRVKDGNVVCKTGTFENVEISGTLTEGTVQIDGNGLYNQSSRKSVYVVGAEGMKSVTINNPSGNLVCLPTYNGFTDKVYEWDGNFEGVELEKEFLSVPAFKRGGTHLTIQTSPVSGLEGWAALSEERWTAEGENHLGELLKRCVVVCADPQLLVRDPTDGRTHMPSHAWNGRAYSTGVTQGSGYYSYAHGRLSYKGAIGRLLLLLPGQHLHLVSSVETVTAGGKKEQCLVWHIENAADFTPIAMRLYVNESLSAHYTDFKSYTTDLAMSTLDPDFWQDMLFAPPILDVKRNGAGYGSNVMNITIELGGADTDWTMPRVVFNS